MTDWEIGNDILNNVIDTMNELAKECHESHPDIAEKLRMNALAWGYHVNGLMDSDSISAPENKFVTKKFNEFVTVSTVRISERTL